MIINRITKLIGIGAFLCCSLTIAAQKLRSVSAHSNMHHDLIASQRDMSDQIKVQETREFMNELLEDEQEPEIDIYTEGWNSNLVNPYAHQAVPNNVRIDVSDYAMPVPGFITSPYGYRPRFRRQHKGVDLKLNTGDTVRAAFAGKVRLTRFERGGYGYYVILRHANGLETVYGHLSRFLVKPNQTVNVGDPIALGGSTGRGHLTDQAIIDTLSQKGEVEIVWKPDVFLKFHPNGMKFEALGTDGSTVDSWTVFSIGGGTLANEHFNEQTERKVYEMSHISDILQWCDSTGYSFWEYVEQCEGKEIIEYLREVWDTMQKAVERGLNAEGVMPGGLGLRRKALTYYVRSGGMSGSMKSRGLIYAYALAVSEENACGGRIVTAPTCGSCGVMPAVLYHIKTAHGISDERIVRALATAGLFGNVAKTNASISGAEVGCQGEVGVACAMAAAAACQLFGGTESQIEYAAEMGLEHHLGLTCDPVCGLVQIPCIERNAFAAARAFDANSYANFTDGRHRVSFDQVVEVMKRTGHDLPSLYKETSQGGLAANFED